MKTKTLKTSAKKILFGFSAVMMIFLIASCSNKAVFQTSSVVPAARGYVKMKTDKNNNNVIQIQVSNLAGVERLQPEKESYVVWMLTDQDITKNIGRLSSSKKLNASFETVTSFKPKKIFITAENDENNQYPSQKIVLTTDTF